MRISRLSGCEESVVRDFFFDKGPLNDKLAEYLAKIKRITASELWEEWYKYNQTINDDRVGLSDVFGYCTDRIENDVKELSLMADELVEEREAEIPAINEICKVLSMLRSVLYVSSSTAEGKRVWQDKIDQFANRISFLSDILFYHPSFTTSDGKMDYYKGIRDYYDRIKESQNKVMEINGRMGIPYMIVDLCCKMVDEILNAVDTCESKEDIPSVRFLDTEENQVLEVPKTFWSD